MLLLHSVKNKRIEAVMGVFARKKATSDLAYRLGELSTEVRELKTAHKHLELEWEELYDKVRHQMARMSRRAKVEPVAEFNDAEPEIPAGDMPTVDPISARILRRRNAGGFSR